MLSGLNNFTGMPIELNAKTKTNKVITNGEVIDEGMDNEVVNAFTLSDGTSK